MKTAEYVKQFKLDTPNYNFNREKFMKAFGQEFKDRIEAMMTACKKIQVQFTYEKFLHAIKEQQDKFWQISKKKLGEPLSDGLFSAFFALHVIPLRANLFPNVHAEIEERRQKALEREAKFRAEEEERQREAKEKAEKMKPLLDAVIAYGAAQNLAKQGKVKATKTKGKR